MRAHTHVRRYQEIAASAHQVLTQQAQRDGTPTKTSGPAAAAVAAAASAGTKSGGSSSGGGNSSNSSSVTEVVAQELYRTVLFVVFYAEVFVLGRLPLIGRALYFTFLSWLYAFYCYDYKWEALKVTTALYIHIHTQ